MQYENAQPSRILTTANEIHIPTGEPVRILLQSNDLIHSFWVPTLHGKTDLIPGIVNNFIGLFKDTSLVTVVGIFDLLGIVQSGFNDPKWASAQTGNTGYFALALIYWVFCFGMSRYSMYIERKLNTGHKR